MGRIVDYVWDKVVLIPSDILLTPHGLLRMEPVDPPGPWLDAEAAERVANALEESPARGLLHLATGELHTPIPPAAGWWRELGRQYLTQLCHTPNLEEAKEISPSPVPTDAERASWMESAPLMRGGEYLSTELLAKLWMRLDELVRA